MTDIQHVVERARLAVAARAGHASCPDRVGGLVQAQPLPAEPGLQPAVHEHFQRLIAEALGRSALMSPFAQQASPSPLKPIMATSRSTALPAPIVRRKRSAPAFVPPSRPSCAPLGTLVDLSSLKRGPRRLLELLHGLAVDVVSERKRPVIPSQETIHQSQELLGAALGVHRITVWRWTTELKALGLIDCREHYTTSQGMTRVDGLLFAVTLRPGHRGHLAHDDLIHQWRDLDGDREAGRTAWNFLQQSDPNKETEWLLVLRAWAVNPGSFTSHPLVSDCCNSPETGPQTVLEVTYALPLLTEAHPSRRVALVGMWAGTLARQLDRGMTWHRLWCRLIWQALAAENEGRGGLHVLAAQLTRLEIDRQEWHDLKKPAALLAARMRAA